MGQGSSGVGSFSPFRHSLFIIGERDREDRERQILTKSNRDRASDSGTRVDSFFPFRCSLFIRESKTERKRDNDKGKKTDRQRESETMTKEKRQADKEKE